MRTSTVQPPLGTPINANHTLSKGLVGCWLLNEGGGQIAIDSTRLNPVNGVLTNGPFFKQTSMGNAVIFDGVNDLITIPNSAALSITNDITLSAWVFKLTDPNTFNQVIMKNNSNVSYYGFYINNLGKVVFQIAGSAPVSTTSISLKVWYHICCTRNINLASANAKIYINGVQDPTTATGTTAINTATATLSFATDAFNAGRQANMLLKDVKIYNRALSATEVMQLYTNPYSMYQTARPLKLAV